jgi:ATP-dependent Clp protease ATP-binding subunit ClpA
VSRSFHPTDFEHYSMEARQVIGGAVTEAHRLGANSLLPEHLLLGILFQRPLIEKFLRPEQLQDLRETIERHLGPGEGQTSGDLPLTLGARGVLNAAQKLVERRKDAETRPIHILAALVIAKTELARILAEHGIPRRAVMRVLSERISSPKRLGATGAET